MVRRTGEWTHHHLTVFFLTFFSYAAFHAVRKTLSNVKATLSEEWTPCGPWPSSPYAADAASYSLVASDVSGTANDVDNRRESTVGFNPPSTTQSSLGSRNNESASTQTNVENSLAARIDDFWDNYIAGEKSFPQCPREESSGGSRTAQSGKGENGGLFQNKVEAEKFLGGLDSSFMFTYALGLYISGWVADRNDLRLLLTVGMVLNSLVFFLIGPGLEWTGHYSQPAYLFLMVVSGLVQSVGWPCVVAVMGNWFDKGSRGLVLGLWSSCQSVGNVLGALVVSVVLGYGYEYAFLVTSSILLSFAVLIFFGLVPTPLDLGLPLPDEEATISVGSQIAMTVLVSKPDTDRNTHIPYADSADSLGTTRPSSPESVSQTCTGLYQNDGTDRETSEAGKHSYTAGDQAEDSKSNPTDYKESDPVLGRPFGGRHSEDPGRPPPDATQDSTERYGSSRRPQAIGFLTALLLPGVIPYSLAFAFLKLVHYAFFFWLPFYLTSAFGMQETKADQLSIWYDVGGILGAAVAGFLSDRLERRAVVQAPMLLMGMVLLHLYGRGLAGQQMTNNGILLGVIGVLIGGVANIMSAVVVADLGRQDLIRGNKEALSTVTGIVDGSGSVGAAIGQVVVPYLQVAYGWGAVFYFLTACILLSVICILPVLVAEVAHLFLSVRLGYNHMHDSNERRWSQRPSEQEPSGDDFSQTGGRETETLATDAGASGKSRIGRFFDRLCDFCGGLCERMSSTTSTAPTSDPYFLSDNKGGYASFGDVHESSSAE